MSDADAASQATSIEGAHSKLRAVGDFFGACCGGCWAVCTQDTWCLFDPCCGLCGKTAHRYEYDDDGPEPALNDTQPVSVQPMAKSSHEGA